MAFTATLVKNSIMSNQRVSQYLVTADAASGVVVTNIGVIDSIAISPVSLTTGAPKIKINTTVASAAANGSVFVSSITSGDSFFLMVYGH